jgi:hypothetical protein
MQSAYAKLERRIRKACKPLGGFLVDTLKRFGVLALVAAGLLGGCAEETAVTTYNQEALAQQFMGQGSVISGSNENGGAGNLIMESTDARGGYYPEWGFLQSEPHNE